MLRILLYCVLSFGALVSNATVLEVDFDTSMGIEERGRYNLLLRDGENSKNILGSFRNLYNKNLPSKLVASKYPKIPKIIHRIWIGPHPFPPQYKEAVESCKKLHPSWKFILWTNKDVKNILSIDTNYQWLFNEYKEKRVVYQAQKDILEYLILSKYGGVYLDADVQCVQNMDELVHKYKFFSAIEPPSRWTKTPVLSNRVIGVSPGNKIMYDTLKIAAQDYKETYKQKNNNPLKRVARRIFKGKYIKVPNPCIVLMGALAKAVVKNGTQSETIAFPATYFDPIFPKLSRYDFADEIKFRLGIYKNKNKLFKKIKPETIGISTDFVTSKEQLVPENSHPPTPKAGGYDASTLMQELVDSP